MNSDWTKLTKEQRAEVNAWKERIFGILRTESEVFEQGHPELYMGWGLFPCPLLRAEHPEMEPPARKREGEI